MYCMYSCMYMYVWMYMYVLLACIYDLCMFDVCMLCRLGWTWPFSRRRTSCHFFSSASMTRSSSETKRLTPVVRLGYHLPQLHTMKWIDSNQTVDGVECLWSDLLGLYHHHLLRRRDECEGAGALLHIHHQLHHRIAHGIFTYIHTYITYIHTAFIQSKTKK